MEVPSRLPDISAMISKLKSALKAWYRDRAKAWWSCTTQKSAICDDCNRALSESEGYLRVGNYLCCELCTDTILESADWQKAAQDLNSYFGPGIPAHIQQLTLPSRDMGSVTTTSKAGTPTSPTGAPGPEALAALLNSLDEKGAQNLAATLNQAGPSAGTTPAAKTVLCRYCGNAKSETQPHCQHCRFTDWPILTALLFWGVVTIVATLLWFESPFWVLTGWIVGALATGAFSVLLGLNLRALRKHSRGKT